MKRIYLAISVTTYCTVMYYITFFLICSHIPPNGDKLNDFGSNTRGIGVFLLTLNWYIDRRETSPTLVCISPNRIPVKISNSSLERVPLLWSYCVIYCGLNHRLEHIHSDWKFYHLPCRYRIMMDWKTQLNLTCFWTKLFHSIEHSCL